MRVARFGERDIARLLADDSIVRHRGKIEATIANAQAIVALDLSLADLVSAAAPPPRARPQTAAEIPAQTDASVALARELKRRGFRFVGPTTVYAFMQAAGIVDDHLVGCLAAGPGPAVEARESSRYTR